MSLNRSFLNQGLWVFAISLSLALGACSSASETNQTRDNAQDDDDDTSSEEDDEQGKSDDDDEPASGGSKSEGSTARMDAGAKGGGTGRMDGGAVVTSGKSDASTSTSSVDGGGGGGVTMSRSDGGSPAAPPSMLPDPAEPGPYEIVVEENVGKGFELAINSSDQNGGGVFCDVFVQSFGADPEEAAEFASIPDTINMALYQLYRPTNLEEGKKYPVLSWGNGTCALPHGYGTLLKHVASHGFIVVAAYSRFVGSGEAQRKGIDFVFSLGKDENSPLFGKVDESKVGVFGHSQGAAGTAAAASADARVKAAVPLNTIGGGGFKQPVFFLTGDGDLMPAASESGFSSVNQPAAVINLKDSDHITLMNSSEPERVYPAVTAWFRYHLLGDEVGKSYFAGSDCKLCSQTKWSFKAKNLK